MMNLIEQAFIFIAGAVILVPLFQKLGLGSILGYLVSGLIVGPYGLRLVRDAESIMHFSEFGVVMLLFIIGLEIQPRKLWSMKRHLFQFGFFQILICSVLFSGCAYLFGLSLTASIVVGFSMSLSSTAFAVQTLKEQNLFNTEFGRASFSILLAQDLFAIPALAIIPAVALSKKTDPGSLGSGPQTFYFVLIALVLVVVGRFLMRPIFRIIASTRSREIFTAVTLFIVLGVATLMQKVGLSAALGTFVAGVLLADSEYRHELEANIEPFKGLFMGLFFIAVGMSVNLDLVLKNPLVVLLLAISYLLLKGVGIYLLGRGLRMNHQNSKMLALTIAQGGEFAFVIFGLVADKGFIDSSTIDYLTVIISMSMALNPVFSLLNEAFSKVQKKAPEYDQIKDEKPRVIIAGFGRFGQTFGRILRAQEIPFVAIDHDSDQVELVRKFGNQVYFGDASRKELLETAGAETAQFFILAIDDVELSLKTAQLIKDHFPHLKIFARARNRGHAFDLMELGIQNIKREIFDGSLAFTQELLVELGFEAERAAKIAERFRTHDEIMFHEQFKVRQDAKTMISVSKQGIAQLAEVLNDDSRQTRIVLPTQKKATEVVP